MSHFAQLKNGIVQQVIVAEQDFIDTLPDKEDWIQTSYNTKGNVHYGPDGQPDGGIALRGNFAGIGFIYDAEHDVFYEPPPPNDPNPRLNTSTWLWDFNDIGPQPVPTVTIGG